MTDSKETPPGMLSLELVRRLCRAERRAARASLASQFTHELGTPLNVLLGRASMVVAATTDKPEVQKNASLVADTGKDIASRLRGLLEREAIPRHDAGAGATAPSAVLAAIAAAYAPLAAERGVTIGLGSTVVTPTSIDEVLLWQLVSDKLDALLAGGTGHITLETATEHVERPADLRCAPGLYLRISLWGEVGPEATAEPRDESDDHVDEHALRASGGFLRRRDDGMRGWDLYFPARM